MRQLIPGTIAVLSLIGLIGSAPSAMAQAAAPAPSAAAAPSTGCNVQKGGDASKAEAATQPNTAAADGTSPGNSGSTGWTGGTGGAYIGNNPQGASKDSPNWHPPTARGLELNSAAEPAPVPTGTSGC